ncbi:CPBP family intramembrane metalloprotease [Xylella taiwanensis]|uniref:CPBP family intramembrane metalloprotease n=1 Tax=Xylella taiwanensis TaxID=1444770 RepID=Z9JLJ1_9GAMM|nr:CPBP family intramembrane glutamic endopeptidase [Xylella taiwanensis]AXI82478.1 membrane protein [Xylella taiwanensis]EWS79285.1 membrane protein [Xylella taiwanensis]MCD8455469.1 CPBP family intramembrane metalloprotease [Xylella taiwanensis]MCD8457874.1 CPBP family intramembrane metalloprotease [Xylella taiwanensis]MCD8460009.1 CPBP family intramembrane metalloprotease [Xylella taiwanensis]
MSNLFSPATTSTHRITRLSAVLIPFGIDVLLSFVTIVLISTAVMLLWATYRGVMLTMHVQQQTQKLDSQSISVLIGQPDVLVQMLVALIAIGGTALLLYFWRCPATVDERYHARLALCRTFTWNWIIGVALLTFLFSVLSGVLAEQLGIRIVPSNQALIQEGLVRWPLFVVLFVVLLVPAYEELLFRRVLLSRFLVADRPVLGITLSSLAFAFLHEIPGLSSNSWLAVLYLWLVYMILGAAFGWVYWRTGSLWASIVTHGFNNICALIGLYFWGIQ